jgi:hypothetical protein
MIVRDYKARIKAAGKADGLGEGEFKALVSVFGNTDSYGEVVMPGAFTDTLSEDWSGDNLLPIVWSHKWDDPFSHIGYALSAEETEAGLVVHGKNDVDDNATAAQVQRLMKGRRITQFSFAYDVLEGGEVMREVEGGKADEGETVYELRKLKLHEVGPCLLGVNQETELIAAKALSLANSVQSGRRIDSVGLDRLGKAVAALRETITISTSTSVSVPTGSGYDGGESTVQESQTSTDPADEDLPAEDKSEKAAEVPRRRVLIESLFL